MAHLRIPHMNFVRGEDPRWAEILQTIENAVNLGLKQVTASPVGATDPPPNIASLTVQVTNVAGLFDFAIVDNSPVNRGINYFVEWSTTSNFAAPHVIDLGASRNEARFLGAQTLYFRAYSAYPTSARSQPVYFGAPTAVNGTVVGSATPLASQGSGTSTGANGGDGGFGNEPERNTPNTRSSEL